MARKSVFCNIFQQHTDNSNKINAVGWVWLVWVFKDPQLAAQGGELCKKTVAVSELGLSEADQVGEDKVLLKWVAMIRA